MGVRKPAPLAEAVDGHANSSPRKQHGRTHSRRAVIEPWLMDREAVRPVMSDTGFAEIERVRREQSQEEPEETFWPIARAEMVRHAQQRPDSAIKILKAKAGAVGAMLGLAPEKISEIVSQVNLPIFIAAAHENLTIQQFRQDARFCGLWSDTTLNTNPPIRVEFEHATVFGSINEAGDIAKSKTWGSMIGLLPLCVEDRLHPCNITYQLKPTSKLRMRWEFRDSFKNILGARRSLVNEAMRRTKADFERGITLSDIRVLESRLDLTPTQFWQAVRHGERFGPDGITLFMQRLEEKTKGYALPFPEISETLVQIQLCAQP